jgi:hypothetical protein
MWGQDELSGRDEPAVSTASTSWLGGASACELWLFLGGTSGSNTTRITKSWGIISLASMRMANCRGLVSCAGWTVMESSGHKQITLRPAMFNARIFLYERASRCGTQRRMWREMMESSTPVSSSKVFSLTRAATCFSMYSRTLSGARHNEHDCVVLPMKRSLAEISTTGFLVDSADAANGCGRLLFPPFAGPGTNMSDLATKTYRALTRYRHLSDCFCGIGSGAERYMSANSCSALRLRVNEELPADEFQSFGHAY